MKHPAVIKNEYGLYELKWEDLKDLSRRMCLCGLLQALGSEAG